MHIVFKKMCDSVCMILLLFYFIISDISYHKKLCISYHIICIYESVRIYILNIKI